MDRLSTDDPRTRQVSVLFYRFPTALPSTPADSESLVEDLAGVCFGDRQTAGFVFQEPTHKGRKPDLFDIPEKAI
jgi:hypothetical protein